MAKENKIITFDSSRKLKKKERKRTEPEYVLINTMTMQVRRYGEKYDIFLKCSNPASTEESSIGSLQIILQKLAKKHPKIPIKKMDYYDVAIVFDLYQDLNNRFRFRYIYFPQDIPEEKVTEYLLCFLEAYKGKQKLENAKAIENAVENTKEDNHANDEDNK